MHSIESLLLPYDLIAQDIEQLDAINIPGVVIGKALYEGRLTLEQLL